jgi:hypothetical protein
METALTQRELAAAIGISAPAISKTVRTGKLVLNEDRRIDFSHPINNVWLQKQVEKGRMLDIHQLGLTPNPVKPEKVESVKKTKAKENKTPEPKTERATLQQRKTEAEIEWKKTQIRLNLIKEQQRKGELIPIQAVKTLFQYTTDTIRSTFEQEFDGMLEMIKQIADVEHIAYIELKKDIKTMLNDAVMLYKKNLIKGADKIVAEYRDIKGVGEGD